jgi:lysophospholipase L1-like esterase
MPSRLALAALALLLALALPSAAQAAKKRSTYYVSLGDSYAVGYQATGQETGKTTRNGYANQLVRKARTRGHRLKLVNFGCGGETTTSILTRKKRCKGSAPGAPNYAGRTQVAAAERFLRRHKGEVSLITVSIGGNDVTACASKADPVACVGTAVNGIKANGGKLVKRLRKATGKKTRIVGITYPDVILGGWVSGVQADRDLAGLSVIAFQSLINPALKDVYESVKGRFVDVTEATGAYGSLEELTNLAPYGEVPVPVAEVCRISYYCTYRDIHLTTEGYGIIADLVAKTLPRRKG